MGLPQVATATASSLCTSQLGLQVPTGWHDSGQGQRTRQATDRQQPQQPWRARAWLRPSWTRCGPSMASTAGPRPAGPPGNSQQRPEVGATLWLVAGCGWRGRAVGTASSDACHRPPACRKMWAPAACAPSRWMAASRSAASARWRAAAATGRPPSSPASRPCSPSAQMCQWAAPRCPWQQRLQQRQPCRRPLLQQHSAAAACPRRPPAPPPPPRAAAPRPAAAWEVPPRQSAGSGRPAAARWCADGSSQTLTLASRWGAASLATSTWRASARASTSWRSRWVEVWWV